MKRGRCQRRMAPARLGLTLVELMITISIIAILAGALLFALMGAQEAGRESRTRMLVSSLNTLLMEHYDTYRTRRVPIPVPAGTDRQMAAVARLNAIRELTKIELPDRWSDVVLKRVEDAMPSTIPGSAGIPTVLTQRTALSQAYLRRYSRINPSATADVIRENQGAECLYLIIMLATGDGEASENFSESAIGDTDGDGAPEFLDGWGNPIRFLRWAPGFTPKWKPVGATAVSELQSGDEVEDHDPFDYLSLDADAFRLVPLIYSAGPDGSYDISSTASYVQGINPFLFPLPATPPGTERLGSPGDTNEDDNTTADHVDNIHNHLLGLR